MSRILSDKCAELLLQAEGKALATMDENMQVHVVPVSTVQMADGKIILVNYFFGQTLRNLKTNPRIALAFWKDLSGYQIKGIAEYFETGEQYELTKAYVKSILPDRIVKGIVIITPEQIFDVSAGPEAGREVV